MRSGRAFVLGWLLGVAASGATASEPRGPVFWVCGLSDDATRLVCVADAEPTDAAASDAPPATAMVNGTRFPLDPRRRYSVELWSPPMDFDFVRELTEATICYRSPGCRVSVAPWPAPPARVVRR